MITPTPAESSALAEGRARLGPLAPGAVGMAKLALRGVDLEPVVDGRRVSGDFEPVRAELVIADEHLAVERVQVVELPWARSPLAKAPQAALHRLQALVLPVHGTAFVWDIAPRIVVSPATSAQLGDGTGHCPYDLRAQVQFAAASPPWRFVTVSVGGVKQTYQSADGAEQLAVVSQLRLDPGLNMVTVDAQAGMRRSADRTVLVHCGAKTL